MLKSLLFVEFLKFSFFSQFLMKSYLWSTLSSYSKHYALFSFLFSPYVSVIFLSENFLLLYSSASFEGFFQRTVSGVLSELSSTKISTLNAFLFSSMVIIGLSFFSFVLVMSLRGSFWILPFILVLGTQSSESLGDYRRLLGTNLPEVYIIKIENKRNYKIRIFTGRIKYQHLQDFYSSFFWFNLKF